MTTNPHTVELNTTLDEVMKHFGLTNLDELPVVSENKNEIIGCIWRKDVINEYNKQIFLRDMSGSVGKSLKQISRQNFVHVVDDYFLAEIEAPIIFTGKSLGELNVRAKYKADVLLIKKLEQLDVNKNKSGIQPDANYIIQPGDKLLLFGDKKSLNVLENL
jgi:predicted transcriptional regulator